MSRAIKITPTKLKGVASAPPSKSVAHRAVIAASLARGGSVVRNLELSDDIRATLAAVKALGADVELSGEGGAGGLLSPLDTGACRKRNCAMAR